nr:hypothetical protein Iba_chr01bCG3880 [Ipomoea batatas]
MFLRVQLLSDTHVFWNNLWFYSGQRDSLVLTDPEKMIRLFRVCLTTGSLHSLHICLSSFSFILTDPTQVSKVALRFDVYSVVSRESVSQIIETPNRSAQQCQKPFLCEPLESREKSFAHERLFHSQNLHFGLITDQMFSGIPCPVESSVFRDFVVHRSPIGHDFIHEG